MRIAPSARIALVNLIVLVSWLILPVTALATSDISAALYRGIITVTNTSTATTGVSVNWTCNTTALIDGGYINATANNCAMRTSSGTDIAFMPGRPGNPWVSWVSSIEENGINSLLLYTNATGGKIRAFFSNSGATVADNATLELGDNFTSSKSGYVNTDYELEKFIAIKGSAFNTKIFSDGTIVATINSTTTSNSTVMAGATKEYYTLSDDGSSTAYGVNWLAQSTANLTSSYTVTSISVKMYRVNLPDTATVALRTSGGGNNLPTGANLAAGTIDANTLVTTGGDGEWYEVAISPAVAVTSGNSYAVLLYATTANATDYMRWRSDTTSPTYSNGNTSTSADSGATWTAVPGTDFMFALNASASAIASGEKTVTVAANAQVWGIGVDQDPSNSFPLGQSLTINAPLYHKDMQAASFTSKDDNALTISSTAAYSPNGRVYTGSENCSVPASANWNLTTNFTLELWANITSANRDLIKSVSTQDWNTAAANDWLVNVGGDNKFRFYTKGGTTAAATPDITYGSFVHLAVTRIGTALKLYINGADQTAGAPTQAGTLGNTMPLQIGAAQANLDAGMVGTIGEFRVYNGLGMSAAQVLANYNATRWKYDGSATYNQYERIGSGVPDNANAWYFAQNYSMPYFESENVTVNGTQKAHWGPEYADVLTDTINGIVMTPSFRTTSSDADVSAAMTSFETIAQAQAPAYTLDDPPDFISSNITATSGFNTSVNATATGFPLKNVIEAVAVGGQTPSQMAFLILFLFVSTALSISITAGFRNSNAGTGSLWIKLIALVTCYGVANAIGIIDFWMLLAFLLMSPGLALMSRDRGFG